MQGNQKKIKQRIHAKKRARQRYGLDFTTKDLKEIASLIEERPRRNALKLDVRTSRISIWKVTYKEMDLPVAWDRRSKTVTSILPLQVLEMYKDIEVESKCPYCPVICTTAKKLGKHLLKRHSSSTNMPVQIE